MRINGGTIHEMCKNARHSLYLLLLKMLISY